MKEPRRKTKHDRAIRGWPEYQFWRDFAEFLETNPKPPEVLTYIKDNPSRGVAGMTNAFQQEVLELVLKERYPSFVVLKRLKGEK